MCGIFGASALTPASRALLPILASEMQDRGRDSWGSSNGVDVVKNIGPICGDWARNRGVWDGWSAGIWHTRLASHGTVTRENAHPFVLEEAGRKIIGIHNGVINNWASLNSKYERHVPVDSWHIWHHRMAGLTLADVYGYGNLAWWESTPEQPSPTLYVGWFGNRALAVYRMVDGEYVFASTHDAIEKALGLAGLGGGSFYVMEEDKYYRLVQGTEAPIEAGSLGYRVVPTGTGAYNYRGVNGTTHNSWHQPYGYGMDDLDDDGTLPFAPRGGQPSPTPPPLILNSLCSHCAGECSSQEYVCRACLKMLYEDHKMWLLRTASGEEV